MKNIIIIFAIFFFIQNIASAQNAEIKKSAKSGICYSADSKSYKKLKDFTPYKTLNECVAAGGKLPKAPAKKKAA
jgi:hypothetical protein